MSGRRWALTTLFLLLMVGAGCSRTSGDSDESGDPQVWEVSRGTLINTVTATGSIRFSEQARLTFGSVHTALEVPRQWGDHVREGDLLARLETGDLELAVARLEANLLEARETLEDLLEPPSEAVLARAEAGVATAEASLAEAVKGLEELTSGTKVVKAQINADLARVELVNAERNLLIAQFDWKTKLEPNQDQFEKARDSYLNVFKSWLGIDLSGQELEMSLDTLLETWEVDLASLFDPEKRSYKLLQFTNAEGFPLDAPDTPWDETIVYAWVNLFPSRIVISCEDKEALIRNYAQARCIAKEMDDAWDVYRKAKAALETAETQSSKTIAEAENNVSKADKNFTAIQETLEELLGGSSSVTFLQKHAQVKSSIASLNEAQEKLTKLLEPAKETQVRQTKQMVEDTEAALEEAKSRLSQATILAPFDGVVTAVNVEEGQSIGSNAVAVVLVNPESVEITARVDEIDVATVQVGQTALLTLDALPNTQVPAVVDAVAIVGQSQAGVVSYNVRLVIQLQRDGAPGLRGDRQERGSAPDRFGAGGLPRIGEVLERLRARGRSAGLPPATSVFREGMTAVVDIVTQAVDDVLLVPVRAVQGGFGAQTVTVLKDGEQVSRPVTLGESNDRLVIVVEGLEEGEQVIIPQGAGVQQSLRFGGGGFGGGGFPGAGGGEGRRR